MSDNKYWEDDEDDDTTTPPTETDLIKQLRKKAKADARLIAELNEKLGATVKSQNENLVKSILEQKGVNTKAAKLILKDLEEVNADSVNGWLNENSDLFVASKSSGDGDQASTDENLSELGRQNAAAEGALNPGEYNEIIAKMRTLAEGPASDLVDYINSFK